MQLTDFESEQRHDFPILIKNVSELRLSLIKSLAFINLSVILHL